MARVNLEDQLFGQARLRTLARKLGYPEHVALGILSYLWHDSQEFGAVEATADEIAEWSRLDLIQDWEFDQKEVRTTKEVLLEALVKARFITLKADGRYQIHGNEEQIKSLETYRSEKEERVEIARLGGKARAKGALRDESGHFIPADLQPAGVAAGPAENSKNSEFGNFNAKKDENEKNVAPADLPAASPASAGPAASRNAIQCNAIQYNNTSDREARESPVVLFEKLWEEHLPVLKARKIKAWTPSRKAAAGQRYREHPDPEYWKSVFKKAGLSPFIRGERAPTNGHRRFKANIDWFLRPDTAVRILEGHYEHDGDSEPAVRIVRDPWAS